MKKTTKKLTINRETLTRLDGDQLGKAQGGNSLWSLCECGTWTCSDQQSGTC